jgi:hypothetical protein
MTRGFAVTLAAVAHTTWANGFLTAEQLIAQVNARRPHMSGPGQRVCIKSTQEIAFGAVTPWVRGATCGMW